MIQEYEIKLLSDCQEHIPRLAELWYEFSALAKNALATF